MTMAHVTRDFIISAAIAAVMVEFAILLAFGG